MNPKISLLVSLFSRPQITFSVATGNGIYSVGGDEIKTNGNFVCVYRGKRCVASFLNPLSVTPNTGSKFSGESPPYEYRY